jgi:hypothetical protein
VDAGLGHPNAGWRGGSASIVGSISPKGRVSQSLLLIVGWCLCSGKVLTSNQKLQAAMLKFDVGTLPEQKWLLPPSMGKAPSNE